MVVLRISESHVVCHTPQRPKLSPVKDRIRDNLCALLEAHPSVINLKAKTHEKARAAE